MRKTKVQQAAQEAPTVVADVALMNGMDHASIWIWMLARSAPPGARVVPRPALAEKIGLGEPEIGALDRVFNYCWTGIVQSRISPASLVGELAGCGLDLERTLLIVDAAAAFAQSAQGSIAYQNLSEIAGLAQKLDELEALVKGMAGGADQSGLGAPKSAPNQ